MQTLEYQDGYPLAIWGLYLFITQIVSEHEQYAGQWII